MSRIEKTVFISYRRTDVYTALAIYENLKNQGYDVFFDYKSISSGDFEQIITSNIRARAHFLLVLTPTALDRLNEPGDWLRREIETAIDEKRNIIPLFFKGFRFGSQSVSDTLTGKLSNLSRYNGLNVHEDYFDEAMHRLRAQFLNIPLNTILHPVSDTVQKIVQEEQSAADQALEQIEDVKELVKQADQKPVRLKREASNRTPTKPWRLIAGTAGSLVLLALFAWGGTRLLNNQPPSTPVQTQTSEPATTLTFQPGSTQELQTETSNLASSTQTSVPPTATFLPPQTGSDGMTLLYVSAGEFRMGSSSLYNDERPIHMVGLDDFWIDKTEVTNKMYSLCVNEGKCGLPDDLDRYMNSGYANHPVVFVSWMDANDYCAWVGRRLPTEAEWEKAARGPNSYNYPWGNKPPASDLLNYDNEIGETTEAGNYPLGASVYGALDMAGNVWEWVNDWYSETYYSNSPSSDPAGPDSGQFRVLRGGSWSEDDYNVRSARRFGFTPRSTSEYFGFRCAMSATP